MNDHLNQGNDFADVVNVDEIGAVGSPEEESESSVAWSSSEGAVVGGAFEVFGGDGNEASFDGREYQSSASTRSIRCWERIRILLGWVEACLGRRVGRRAARGARGAGVGFRFLFFAFWMALERPSLVEGL